MWRKAFSKNCHSLVLGFFLALVYLAPNLLHISLGQPGTILLRDDEFSYAARILRVEQGYFRVGNEWSWENRNDPSLIPNVPDVVLAAVGKIFPVGFEYKILFLRMLLVFALFFALRAFASGFFANLHVPAALSAWILSDPGLLFYKPIIATLMGNAVLPLNRFTNPLFGLTIFFITMLLVFRAFSERGERKHAIFAGVFLALQFYISVYYWTHTTLWIVFVVIFSKNPKRWQQLVWGIAVTVALAIPYVIHSQEIRQHPVFSTIAWRNGLLLKERGWYLLGHKTIYLFLGIAIWQILRGTYEKKFLGLGVLSGGLIYFSSIVTGVTFQNFHWHYTLAPVAFLLAYGTLPTRISEHKAVLYSLAFVSLVCGGFSGVREYKRNIEQQKVGASLIGKGYEEAFAWIRKNSSPEAVILAGAATAPHIPLKTERRVFYNSIVQFVSAQEVLRHHQLYWHLHGWQGQDLMAKIYRGDSVLAQFEYGFTLDQEKSFRERNFLPISLADIERLSGEVVEIQSAIAPNYFKDFLERKKVDFILMGANEEGWEARVGQLFTVEKVFQNDTTILYQVKNLR